MWSSSEYSSGHRTAKSPAGKSTFSQTCSLLSQHLKEKGSFGDLTLGMTRTVESNGSPETSGHSATTMELFPTISTPRNPETMDFLTLAYPSLSEVPTIVKSSAFESVEKEPKASQLTIFYAGKVLVFDDFPADKVEELMSLVGKGKSQSQNSSAYAQIDNQQQNHPSLVPNIPPEASARPIESQSQNSSAYAQIHNQQQNHPSLVPNIPPEASPRPIESQSQNSSACAQIHNQQQNHPSSVPNIPPEASPRPIVHDHIPMARKASLHRFLKKRKDRISSKAPYQTNSPSSAPDKPVESMAWLGLGAKSTQN